MNIGCAKDSLLQAVSAVQRAIPVRPVIPALSGILIDAKNGMVVGTDLEMSIKYPLDVTVNEEGEILVSVRYFSEIIKSMPEGTIEIKTEDNYVKISSGKSKFKLNTFSVDEFPQLAEEISDNFISINNKKLLSALNHVVKSAARDDSRPILTGVLIKISGSEIEVAATDSYRLAIYKTKIDNIKKLDISFIVPNRALEELIKLIGFNEKDSTEINVGENRVIFKTGNAELTSRLLEGNFPNYNQLIPDEFIYKAKADKLKFINSLKRSSIVAESSPIKIKISNSQIESSSVNQNVGSSSDLFDVDSNIEEIEIAFNPQYIIDGLQSFTGSEIEININDSTKPVMLTSPTEKEFSYIAMPVRIA